MQFLPCEYILTDNERLNACLASPSLTLGCITLPVSNREAFGSNFVRVNDYLAYRISNDDSEVREGCSYISATTLVESMDSPGSVAMKASIVALWSQKIMNCSRAAACTSFLGTERVWYAQGITIGLLQRYQMTETRMKVCEEPLQRSSHLLGETASATSPLQLAGSQIHLVSHQSRKRGLDMGCWDQWLIVRAF